MGGAFLADMLSDTTRENTRGEHRGVPPSTVTAAVSMSVMVINVWTPTSTPPFPLCESCQVLRRSPT